MPRKKQTIDPSILPGLISIIVLAFLGYSLTHYRTYGLSAQQPPHSSAKTSLAYSDEISGLSFAYPSSYRIVEHADINNQNHKIITLLSKIETSPENKIPSLITLDVTRDALQNNKETLEWMQTNTASHFEYSDGTYHRTQIENGEIITYSWEKILPGISVLFEKNGTIVVVSATYENADDSVLADFAYIAKSIHIEQ